MFGPQPRAQSVEPSGVGTANLDHVEAEHWEETTAGLLGVVISSDWYCYNQALYCQSNQIGFKAICSILDDSLIKHVIYSISVSI